MKAQHNALFITASDTGVGKTHITANLLKLLLKNRVNARAIKPIETGFNYDKEVPQGSDVNAYSQINPTNTYPPAYYFDMPASPHYASRQVGSHVDIDVVEDYCRKHIEQTQMTLIEGAGGLLVPFNSTSTNSASTNTKSYNFTHLIKRLHCPIILVINNRLGAINQALVNIQLCDFHGIEIACVVMNQTDPNSELALENITFVQSQTDVPVVQVNQDGSFEEFEQALSKIFDGKNDDFSPMQGEVSKDCMASNKCYDNKTNNTLNFDKNHLWHPYTSMTEPLKAYHVSYAEGKHIYINDDKGNHHKLLDAMSSWWAVNLGYNREALNRSAIRQINQFSHVMFGGLTHDPAVELAKTLIDMLPYGLEKVFYTDSGSVSVEVAIKMALQYQQNINPTKRKILTPMGGYHGDTFGAMSVCDPVNGMHGLFKDMLAEQVFIPRPDCAIKHIDDVFNKDDTFDTTCLQPLHQAITEHKGELAGIIIEPMVQGAGGMRFYHPAYLKHLRELCDEHNMVLIFDEIATGFGRTGEMFASTFASKAMGVNITPDIICLGKALTGGFLSFACTVASRTIAEGISQKDEHGRSNPFMHGPTYMGNPLACAVAKTAIKTLQQSEWQSQVQNIQAWLTEGLAPCRHLPEVADVRVLGAIGVVEMHDPVNVQKIQAYFISQGVWIRPFGKLVYTMPHFNFSKADIERICEAIYGAITSKQF